MERKVVRPPADGPAEIVRFVKRRPKSDDEFYETVQPRRDGRREIILLEPVKFEDEAPDALYDDYSLYRMEEYVDAGTGAHPASQREKQIKEECIAPAKEIDTITLVEEQRKTVEKLRRDDLTSATPPSERGPYVSRVSIGESSTEHPIERGSDAGRSERTCSRCGEASRETPVLDRTIYYEREVVEDGKTTEREVRDHRDSRAPSRQTYFVDDEIAHANKRVDSVLRSHDSRESPMPTLPTVPEEELTKWSEEA
ncbi:hypothetical protein ANCDUO_13505 [Ancylostoma duodenale]|uniref:Uncharacterized protein n=1 Tax=Ancylostoma duodenale TaxID=51022 RepID=A0A0C2GGU9_9BILA|nr:hypothetical protein ANCDUO_13505 [Ancylostoma duodenale]